MSIYDIHGNIVTPCDMNGVPCSAYDILGNLIDGSSGGDYSEATTDYERAILSARDAWIAEARADSSIVPVVVHTDQHDRLTTSNTLFAYLAKAIPWADSSACIGLGDAVGNYRVSGFQNMISCLSGIPKDRQINIWGNHDTWFGTVNDNILTEEHLTTLNTYFDNSAYNGNQKFNDYGIECMVDEARKIKYVVIGGWEYDHTLGGYSHYNIGQAGMDCIVQMLSAVDGYDIILLSHIQPFAGQTLSDWIVPPVGEGELTYGAEALVNKAETTIDKMIIDRKNKASGTVKDSYGNIHDYDFTGCNSDLICCLSGHEHRDKYMWQNGNIPVCLFAAYYKDNHPVYFVNVDRTKRRLNIWKVDDSPMAYNYQIPFDSNV